MIDARTIASPEQAAAVNALADRFWEATAGGAARPRRPSTATTATTTGSTTPRPPGGRRRGRCARRRSPSWRRFPIDGLPVEERITHDMLRVVCELGDPSRTTCGWT